MSDLSVGIIGAGPGGLALGIMLSRAGFSDFTIFDREGGVGGTWRINTYPGLACDVKSHLYSYSFDLNADWSRLLITLRQVWRGGAHAYLGMAVPGFPNLFMLYGPNTNVGSNSVIFILEAQARYIVRALKHMRSKGRSYIAVRPAALADFVAKVDRWMVGTVWTTQCSNYFRAANGRVVTQWPGSARSFWGMTRRFKPGDFRFEPTAGSALGALTLSDRGAR